MATEANKQIAVNVMLVNLTSDAGRKRMILTSIFIVLTLAHSKKRTSNCSYGSIDNMLFFNHFPEAIKTWFEITGESFFVREEKAGELVEILFFKNKVLEVNLKFGVKSCVVGFGYNRRQV